MKRILLLIMVTISGVSCAIINTEIKADYKNYIYDDSSEILYLLDDYEKIMIEFYGVSKKPKNVNVLYSNNCMYLKYGDNIINFDYFNSYDNVLVSLLY